MTSLPEGGLPRKRERRPGGGRRSQRPHDMPQPISPDRHAPRCALRPRDRVTSRRFRYITAPNRTIAHDMRARDAYRHGAQGALTQAVTLAPPSLAAWKERTHSWHSAMPRRALTSLTPSARLLPTETRNAAPASHGRAALATTTTTMPNTTEYASPAPPRRRVKRLATTARAWATLQEPPCVPTADELDRLRRTRRAYQRWMMASYLRDARRVAA